MAKLFKNLTKQEKYAMWLAETKSGVEVESKTGKYKVIKTVDTKGNLFWFLGKAGALRLCRTNTQTKSVDVSRFYAQEFESWLQLKNS